ncbi:hypothetical protein VFA_002852 [Vibrio furnissii CIP 102972]|nr:hypothetical protein VFA_002852 [Vibrio furnissii CIP 102972]
MVLFKQVAAQRSIFGSAPRVKSVSAPCDLHCKQGGEILTLARFSQH